MSEHSRIQQYEAEYLSAWNEAVEALQILEIMHEWEFRHVEECAREVEKHSTDDKGRQTALSKLQVGVAVIAIVEPTATAVLVGSGLAKWPSKRIARRQMKDKFDQAISIMEDDHATRDVFIKAAQRVQENRTLLCEEKPELKKLSMGHLALFLTYPGFFAGIATLAQPDVIASEVVKAALLYPKTTAEIAQGLISAGIGGVGTVADNVGVAGLGLAVASVQVVLDVVPFVGLAINLEKLRRARKDEKRGIQEAEQLLEVYEKSKAHYASMKTMMDQFQPVAVDTQQMNKQPAELFPTSHPTKAPMQHTKKRVQQFQLADTQQAKQHVQLFPTSHPAKAPKKQAVMNKQKHVQLFPTSPSPIQQTIHDEEAWDAPVGIFSY